MWADSRPLRTPPSRGERIVLHFLPGDATLLAAPPEALRESRTA
jgi:hypothetical protein